MNNNWHCQKLVCQLSLKAFLKDVRNYLMFKTKLNIVIISNDSEDYQLTAKMLGEEDGNLQLAYFKKFDEFLSLNKNATTNALVLFQDKLEKDYVNIIETFRETHHYEPIILIINDAVSEKLELLSHFRSVECLTRSELTKLLFVKTFHLTLEKAVLEKTIGEKDKVISMLSEQHRSEKQLQKTSIDNFSSILDLVPAMIWMSDDKMNLTFSNKNLMSFTCKLKEKFGHDFKPLIHLDDLKTYQEVFESSFKKREGFSVEFRLRRYDGEYSWVLNSGIPFYSSDGFFLGYVGVCSDITEIKKAKEKLLHTEEKMRQSPKIEAIGRLAGGIAHDFNNIMGVVMLHADLLLEQMDKDDPKRRRVTEIRSASVRAASLTQQLLAFGRKQVLQPIVVNLNSVVSDTGKMLKRVIGEDIEIKTVLAENLNSIMADPNQMAQVIMNLAINSRDSMPDGGELIISTENVTIKEKGILHEAFQSGNYVKLTITDTGCGIPKEIQPRIFEPFFTTKEQGLGSGLGLSMAYGIVKQSGGYIFVTSEENEGASFEIYMPVHIEKEVETNGDKERLFNGSFVGNETILLVEDENIVRAITSEVLERLGYKILEAENGEEAMERASTYEGEIHLLLTDVIMPKMNGKDLAVKLATLRPDMRILFMSGYNEDIVSEKGVLNEGIHYINKPFSPARIAKKIREVLK